MERNFRRSYQKEFEQVDYALNVNAIKHMLVKISEEIEMLKSTQTKQKGKKRQKKTIFSKK